MLKIGIFGAGHLGKIHLRQLKELSGIYQITGYFDPSDATAEEVTKEFGIRRFEHATDLIHEVDVVDIVTPTIHHYELASLALKKSKHVFIEKPITETVEEARSLMMLAREANVKVQVGHVERFNPAFRSALPFFNKTMFIETHRLAQFNPRGTDVPVVLDLMIHDIDIILTVVKSGVRRVSASGVSIVSDSPDIANARIEFDNGCVANLTSSRISMKNMRKSRFFQKDAYISVDFLTKELEVVRMEDVHGAPNALDIVLELGNGKNPKKILLDKPDIQEINAIREELVSFSRSIQEDKVPEVSLEDGLRALEVAYEIIDKLKSTSLLASNNI